LNKAIKQFKWEKNLKVVLDVLYRQNVPCERWRWGGGSALSFWLRHRDSRDIDIFVSDVQLLTFFSPRLNDSFESIAVDYVELSNILKINTGNFYVAFIAAPVLTENAIEIKSLFGYEVPIETPIEIVLKKLFYRADELKVRDIVDVVAVLRVDQYKRELDKHFELLKSKIKTLEKRLNFLKEKWAEGIGGLDIYDNFLKKPDIVYEFENHLESVKKPCKSRLRQK
jgi:hypothetical protein